MFKISNELKVALTILAAIAVGFLGYRLMSDLPVFRQSIVAYSYFHRADGLTPGNYIYINGVKVGSVKGMELTSGDSVKVTMGFDLGIEIPENSVAYLESSGLLGEKAIIVERGDAEETIEYGEVIKGVYRGGMMETLKQEGEQLSEDVSESFEQLNKLLAELNNLLDKEAKGKIQSTLTNLQKTTNEISILFKNKSQELQSSITHAQRFLANIDTLTMRNESRVDSALIRLNEASKQIEILSRNLNKTNTQLTQILAKINEGQGTLGKLVNDPTLYNNFESLSAELNTLIKNINENPGKYLKHMRLIEVF
ncbi:MAG TPA: MlaD family protein [Balneolaceae bacterium]